MATLEITPLSSCLDDEDSEALVQMLEENGASPLDIDESAESSVIHSQLDDDILVDFLDRLEASEASAEIYLPVDFEDTFELGEHRFGSAHALLLALGSLREDFGIEEDDEDLEEDDDPEFVEDDVEPFDTLSGEDSDEHSFFSDDEGAEEMKDDHLRLIWRVMKQGALDAIRKGLCLRVRE